MVVLVLPSLGPAPWDRVDSEWHPAFLLRESLSVDSENAQAVAMSPLCALVSRLPHVSKPGHASSVPPTICSALIGEVQDDG
eukprot:CAMPEP_0169147098 /NCGR_PEP_ID=MMETSP1015-20121227/48005_1 /TAXON_ID=342587 /ORGANISM="Karlodinium micrum, Strain CCMP2283" /LENGTH=81 /DNA_ID=CAMNT_0009215215 /DNA_START=301 /DNA_END=546 /DNA_ORIENTATION=+